MGAGRMNLLKILDPREKKWWRREEWVRVTRSQNTYEVAERHNCPSWELEFYFTEKYKHKQSCEVRWRIDKRQPLFDKTIFEEPEEWIKNQGKGEGHYILMEEINVYEGGDYE